MTEVSKEVQEKMNKLTMMEQQLSGFLTQKQTFQAQLMEVESALDELGKTEQAFKIVGNIMVGADKEALKKEMEEKQETMTLRIKSIEKQEETIRNKATELQQEVMKELK